MQEIQQTVRTVQITSTRWTGRTHISALMHEMELLVHHCRFCCHGLSPRHSNIEQWLSMLYALVAILPIPLAFAS